MIACLSCIRYLPHATPDVDVYGKLLEVWLALVSENVMRASIVVR